MVTAEQLAEFRRQADKVKGFDHTRFEIVLAHTEDRGIGLVADYVDVDHQLVAVLEDDEPMVIADRLDLPMLEGLASYLNAAGPLAAAVRALVDEVARLRSFEEAYSAIDSALAGVEVRLVEELTGQPCVDRIAALRAVDEWRAGLIRRTANEAVRAAEADRDAAVARAEGAEAALAALKRKDEARQG